jgi:transcriptional regulator with GAF, ATPase, and Fis domain
MTRANPAVSTWKRTVLVNEVAANFESWDALQEKNGVSRGSERLQPGNVRELQNVIERSLIIGETNEFSIDKSWFSSESQPARSPAVDQTSSERTRIEAALAQSNGKIAGASGAAAKLGMPPSTLESRIRSLKINKFQFKGV